MEKRVKRKAALNQEKEEKSPDQKVHGMIYNDKNTIKLS